MVRRWFEAIVIPLVCALAFPSERSWLRVQTRSLDPQQFAAQFQGYHNRILSSHKPRPRAVKAIGTATGHRAAHAQTLQVGVCLGHVGLRQRRAPRAMSGWMPSKPVCPHIVKKGSPSISANCRRSHAGPLWVMYTQLIPSSIPVFHASQPSSILHFIFPMRSPAQPPR